MVENVKKDIVNDLKELEKRLKNPKNVSKAPVSGLLPSQYQPYPSYSPVGPAQISSPLRLSPSKYLPAQSYLPQAPVQYAPAQSFVQPSYVQPSYVQPQPVQYVQPQPVQYVQQPVQYVQAPVQASQVVQVPVQTSVAQAPIKGESYFEYVPFEKVYYEQVPQTRVEYVSVPKAYTDYYAIEKQVEYVPTTKYETIQEIVPQQRTEYVPQTYVEYVPQTVTDMVPVDRVEEKVDYQAVERKIIHYPQYEQQFAHDAETSGRIVKNSGVLPQSLARPAQTLAAPAQSYVAAPQLAAPAYVSSYAPVQYATPQYAPSYAPAQYAPIHQSFAPARPGVSTITNRPLVTSQVVGGSPTLSPGRRNYYGKPGYAANSISLTKKH